jgi:hypothetical protein
MYRPVVTICTTSLTLHNSTFCPQSVFMCLVWIWEQTAIISPYSIDWLVFITRSAYCAVRTEYLCIIQVRCVLNGLFHTSPLNSVIITTPTNTSHPELQTGTQIARGNFLQTRSSRVLNKLKVIHYKRHYRSLTLNFPKIINNAVRNCQQLV